MLAKMVYKNMEKKNVLFYSISIALSIVLEIFFLTAFTVKDQYGLNEKAGNMNWLCTMAFLIAGIISVFFIFYSTGYYMKTKNRDYALLLMLGSDRKTIFKFFSVEFLFIYIFSVFGGILAGGLLSALLPVVLRTAGFVITVFPSDILWIPGTVVKISFLLFFIEWVIMLLYFCKRDLSGFWLREMKKEGKPGWSCFLVIGGIALFVYAMELLKRENILYHFISMIICLAGIYTIMSFGGSLILILLKLFKGFYYKHMLTLNEFYYKFKSNCKLLFIMLVLDFVILFFTGASVISQTPKDEDSPAYPYGFVGVSEDDESEIILREMLGNDSIAVSAIKGYREKADLENGERSGFCISDRDYNRLTSGKLHLEDNEAIWVNESTALEPDTVDVIYLDQEDAFTVTERRNEIIFATEKPDCLREFAVLPEAAVTGYKDTYRIIVKKGNLEKEFATYQSLFSSQNADVFWRYEYLKEAHRNMFFVKIIILFTGVYCLFSIFGIFALKMQGDIPFLNRKYKMLHHMGMTKRSIYKAMSLEYGKILGIPVILSVLLSGIYMLAEMEDRDMLIHDFLFKYVPFQAIFVCFHIAYFYWIKKVVIKKSTMIIVNG